MEHQRPTNGPKHFRKLEFYEKFGDESYLIQVNVICLQIAQWRFNSFNDMFARETTIVRAKSSFETALDASVSVKLIILRVSYL